jgi:hypothetical protein
MEQSGRTRARDQWRIGQPPERLKHAESVASDCRQLRAQRNGEAVPRFESGRGLKTPAQRGLLLSEQSA